MKFITLFRKVEKRPVGNVQQPDIIFETIVQANFIVEIGDRTDHNGNKLSGCYVGVLGSQLSRHHDERSKEDILELIKNTPDLENI